MTDKKRIHQILSSLWKNDNSVGKTYYNQALQDVQTAIDLQEEPVSEELEEAANNALISLIPSFGQKNSDGSYVSSYRDCFEREEFINLFKAGAKWQKLNDMGITNNTKGLVSNVLNLSDEPLDIYATEVAFMMLPANLTEKYHMTNRNRISDAVRLGAKWQEEQFEKERLKHCEALTEEQAQIESDFVTQHLKENNRIPTFIDAIEYGMRLQKEHMMKDAIDGEVGYWNLHGLSVNVELPSTIEEGDKVKVIVIKEE